MQVCFRKNKKFRQEDNEFKRIISVLDQKLKFYKNLKVE